MDLAEVGADLSNTQSHRLDRNLKYRMGQYERDKFLTFSISMTVGLTNIYQIYFYLDSDIYFL